MKKIFNSAEKLLTRFVCYAIVGWLYEEFLWIVDEHLVVNRGFCLGPWLPIYGFGGLIIGGTMAEFAKRRFPERFNIKPLLVFLIVSAAAAAIELVSTYIMDFAGLDFHTLWAYDEYAINFQERIALLPALQFGMLGIVIIYLSYDRIDSFVKSDEKRIVYMRYALCVIFLIDLIVHMFIGSNYTGIPFMAL
ncbi:MAG: putative ABC transporter permease [Solobacterium sp.]|nr:putative ABC transporter permease [Solobacterium sp.]